MPRDTTPGAAGGKICIHSPHQLDAAQPQVQYLNVNKEIIALAAGCLDPALGHDLLFIGTPTHLQVCSLEGCRNPCLQELSSSTLKLGKAVLTLLQPACNLQAFTGTVCLDQSLLHAYAQPAAPG